MSRPETIEIQKWARHGGMLINTECLEIEHPMHPYNQIRRMGLNPKDYGVKNPLEEEFKNKTRDELIQEIIELRREIMGYVRAGF